MGKPPAMIEVFQTNVHKEFQATMIIAYLQRQFPGCRINFDLDDCDRILRMEGQLICPDRVADLMQRQGFHCTALE